MDKNHYMQVRQGQQETRLLTNEKETLLQALRAGGFEIESPCAGNGTCGQCKVLADGQEVLACQTLCEGITAVLLPEVQGNARVQMDEADIRSWLESDFGIAGYAENLCSQETTSEESSVDQEPSHAAHNLLKEKNAAACNPLGLAVDIGTTTVVTYLYDLGTGKCIGTQGELNRQRAFGADVISRISQAAGDGKLEEMCRIIRQQITDMAAMLCSSLKLPQTVNSELLSKIAYISIAGNTVMEHLFAGLDPTGIGVAPFTPLSLFGEERSAGDFFDWAAQDCRLYLCPCVAGYVGGDITAGLLSSGAYTEDKPVLFIDIGTNGEMAVGSRDGFLCCATAAGPAFEGAQIECGCAARDGAINKVEEDLSFSVIGDGIPTGICGSALIDAVAAFLQHDVIDETGYMEDGNYYFSEDVYLSGQDIRQVQLAKAAIRAGAETLLEKSGMAYADISKVIIAGGFGAYMNVANACAIGLLPPELEDKTLYAGNTAGKGAAIALTTQGRAMLEALTKKCAYEELSSSPEFNDHYIEAMMFD